MVRTGGAIESHAGREDSSRLKLAIVTDPHYLDGRDDVKIRAIGRELERERDIDAVLYLGDYSCLQAKGKGNLSVPEKAKLAREFFSQMDAARIEAKFFGVVMGNNDNPESLREIFSKDNTTEYSSNYKLMQGETKQLGRYEVAGFGGKMRKGSGGKVPPNTQAVFEYTELEQMLSGIESPQYTVLATHECKVLGGGKGDIIDRISSVSKMIPPAIHIYGHDHCEEMKLRLTDCDSGRKYGLENQRSGASKDYDGVSVTRTCESGGDNYTVEYSKSQNPHTTLSLKARIAMFGGYSVIELNDTGDYRRIEIKDRKVKS